MHKQLKNLFSLEATERIQHISDGVYCVEMDIEQEPYRDSQTFRC